MRERLQKDNDNELLSFDHNDALVNLDFAAIVHDNTRTEFILGIDNEDFTDFSSGQVSRRIFAVAIDFAEIFSGRKFWSARFATQDPIMLTLTRDLAITRIFFFIVLIFVFFFFSIREASQAFALFEDGEAVTDLYAVFAPAIDDDVELLA